MIVYSSQEQFSLLEREIIIMNTFQSCRNISDAVALYLPQNLYLKPIARIYISVQLPHEIQAGKSISNWEIMEKLRQLIKPDEFVVLKVVKSTLEFIRFEAEIEDKAKLFKIIALLDARTLKLAAFTQNVKIRATEAKCDFPSRHTWDSFFRDAKNMDEMKPGERPDTIHITNLPITWFVPLHHVQKDNIKPSQKILIRVFEKFGCIRHVDIPICDPYRSKMKEHINGMKTFTFDQEILFEGYVQFKDYLGFSRAMDAFRGMKLLRKEGNDSAQTVNIKVDFDKTKHLSDASIRRRQIVRDRLISKDRECEEKVKQEKNKLNHQAEEKRQQEIEQKEEKEKKRREREEKRKAKHFAQFKLKETEELKKKIAKEEKKLLKAQRKLEAIRLIEELFKRIELKREKDAKVAQSNIEKYSNKNELTKFKIQKELHVKEQRAKLQKALEGHVVLNSILGNDKHNSSETSSDSESDENRKHKKKKKKDKKRKKSKSKATDVTKTAPDSNWFVPPGGMHPLSQVYRPPDPDSLAGPSSYHVDPNWFVPPSGMHPYTQMYRPPLAMPPTPGYYPQPGFRGRYPGRRGARFWGRGYHSRGRGVMPQYPAGLEKEYYKYFQKFLKEDHDDRERKSYSNSRSRSRSRSRSYSRSRSRSKSRRRSRSRSYKSRSKSRSRSRTNKSRDKSKKSRSKSRSSRSRSRNSRGKNRTSRSRSRSKSRNRDKSRSRSQKRSRTQWSKSSRSRSRSRNKTKRRSKSRSKSREKNGKSTIVKSKNRSRSRSPSYQSIDSSKFISPSRLRSKRSRSKSWSLPRNSEKKRSSWSKTPSPIKK